MGKLFISYRRIDSNFTHRLAEKLTDRIDGVVFIDLNIEKDDFVIALESEIHSSNVFLLVVTDNTFASERIHQDDDWIRREVNLALTLKKPICLVLEEYKTPPPPHELPEDIANIATKQGIPIYLRHFDEGVANIARHCVSISDGALKLKETVEISEQKPSIHQAGQHNIQQNVHSASNSTIIGQQVNSDNRRRDALVKIEVLRKDRAELINRLNRAKHNPSSATTSQGYVFKFAGVLFLILVGFLLHPFLGIGAIGLITAYFIFQTNEHNNGIESQQDKIRALRKKISEIDIQIKTQRDIESHLH